jgi:hypothetical protein
MVGRVRDQPSEFASTTPYAATLTSRSIPHPLTSAAADSPLLCDLWDFFEVLVRMVVFLRCRGAYVTVPIYSEKYVVPSAADIEHFEYKSCGRTSIF